LNAKKIIRTDDLMIFEKFCRDKEDGVDEVRD